MPEAGHGLPRPNDLFLVLPALAAGVMAILLRTVVGASARAWPPPDPWVAIRGPLSLWAGVATATGDAVFAAFAAQKWDRARFSG
jgi:hypothetical protein